VTTCAPVFALFSSFRDSPIDKWKITLSRIWWTRSILLRKTCIMFSPNWVRWTRNIKASSFLLEADDLFPISILSYVEINLKVKKEWWKRVVPSTLIFCMTFTRKRQLEQCKYTYMYIHISTLGFSVHLLCKYTYMFMLLHIYMYCEGFVLQDSLSISWLTISALTGIAWRTRMWQETVDQQH
jgi:hypothetical protein